MKVEHAGRQIYYYTGGESHQAGYDTMLFIHGAAMNHTVWTLFSRYWAKAGYNVVALDLPGHGLSAGDAPKSIEQSAEFVCDFLRQCRLAESVYVVGHSMGSLVALECAAQLGGVKKLAMLGTSVPMVVGDELLNAAKDNNHSSVDMVSLFGHSYGSQLGGNPIAGISAQLVAERILESAGEGVMYAGLSACNKYKSGFEAAAKISCPVGLVLGALDQMTPPRHAAKLLQTFANARQISIPDCGHMMMSEKPEATHLALREVIEGP